MLRGNPYAAYPYWNYIIFFGMGGEQGEYPLPNRPRLARRSWVP